ncbi:hypothetical protein [Streptomyces sp. RFCAC02]|uniref:hypothetical protein n=1 Tax=Streptomyces sp. RFCAC02 TaxID=2499143 RepID=UPI001020F718|nr:hypothetical protein [Streptomyces sp. RFCAC02]
MPRNRPGRLRAEQPRASRHGQGREPRIAGLTSAAHAEIRHIERTRGHLAPGDTATALRLWREFVHDPRHRFLDTEARGCTIWECCGDPYQARDSLEAVILAMSRRRGRELRRLIDALDDLW